MIDKISGKKDTTAREPEHLGEDRRPAPADHLGTPREVLSCWRAADINRWEGFGRKPLSSLLIPARSFAYGQ